MEKTPRPSNQRLAFLSPVEKLKELCLEEFGNYELKEYRIKEETESLKAFVNLLLLENDKKEENCIIWLIDDGFVRLWSPSGSTSWSVSRPTDTIGAIPFKPAATASSMSRHLVLDT
jgi:hypothetical protein